MPNSADLVTDLPADFEVFGQAVATSMADLLGGTTGQILSKTSNTDMDFTWIANDQGDITAVNVTSPITGGGSAGAVTVGIQDALTTQKGAVQLSDSTSTTSSILAATPTAVKSAYDLAAAAIAKSTVTTNGDTIYGTGSATLTRLGIGSTGQVLTVAGGVPSWATPSSGGMTLISTTALTGSSVTLGTISSAYNELQLWIVDFDPSVSARFRIAPNGNTTAHDNVTLEAAGGGSATTQAYQGYMRTYNTFNTSPSNTIIAVFPAYTSTASRKSAYMTAGFLDGGGGNRTEAVFNKLEVGAITSLVLSPDAGTFSGGTAYLYGVK